VSFPVRILDRPEGLSLQVLINALFCRFVFSIALKIKSKASTHISDSAWLPVGLGLEGDLTPPQQSL
jgi:hypothetical protein